MRIDDFKNLGKFRQRRGPRFHETKFLSPFDYMRRKRHREINGTFIATQHDRRATGSCPSTALFPVLQFPCEPLQRGNVAAHREEIRAETAKLGWLFSTHTTSRSAAELLLFLHGGMMVNKSAGGGSMVKAGRSA